MEEFGTFGRQLFLGVIQGQITQLDLIGVVKVIFSIDDVLIIIVERIPST